MDLEFLLLHQIDVDQLPQLFQLSDELYIQLDCLEEVKKNIWTVISQAHQLPQKQGYIVFDSSMYLL